MKIRNTLIAGCFIFAALTALVGYFGGRAISNISGMFTVVTDDVLPHMRTLDDLRATGLRIVSSTTDIAFVAQYANAEGRRGEADEVLQVEAGTAQLRAIMDRLASHAEFSPEEQAEVAEIREAGDRLVAASDHVVRAVRQRQPLPVLLQLKERFEGEERHFLAAVEKAVAYEAEELAEAKAEVSDSLAFALTTIGLASAVALVLAIVGGVFAARAITRPIATLHDGVLRLGQGDLATTVDAGAPNEIGTLAVAFNLMASDLRAAKDEIVSAKNFLDNIISSLADALVVLSPDGKIISANPALCSLLGFTGEELAGAPFSRIVAGDGVGDDLLRDLAVRGQVADHESFYRACDGCAIPVVLSVAAIKSPAGDVQGIVCIAHDIRERKRAEEEIRQLAFFDVLTGLPNRSLFQERFVAALDRARREAGRVALLFLDLDRFKDINDTLGHATGDQILAAVAARLKRGVRSSHLLARLGGDEFVVLVPDLNDERSVGSFAHAILDLLGPPFEVDGKELFISTSIGIALFPGDGTDGDTLLQRADMALYAAKEQGRNAFRFYSEEMNLRAHERRSMEDSLHRALANGEFFLEYQPQVELHNGTVFGVEALVRWEHPEEGLISPDRFIPVAEETGLIRRIGEWVLRTACLQCRFWGEIGLPPVRVAVNVSGHQFNQPGFIEMVDRVLEETGLDPTRLELELTESSLLEGAQDTIMSLIDLKVRGIHLAIDDFGTGYSSLSYLKHFPIDRLKIDRSFVRDIVSDLDDRSIVEAIIAMAHSLGLRVLAEGVEREEELELLQERGCDEVQGYWFGRPMAAETVERFLAGQRPARVNCPVEGA